MPDSQPIETRNGVSYATHDGVSLLGDLYLPAGAGPFPALVGVHGGGWQAGARNAFQFWGPYLAARGYGLFAISYRLAKKGQKMFPQAVNDVLAAVQFVRGSAGELKIDPERIGLFGASAGGHLASLAALLARQGHIVEVAATAPLRTHRATARARAPRFIEVWVTTPLEECERRDPKHLYARARAGEAPTLPGVGAAYEPPLTPEITATGGLDDDAVHAIARRLSE